MEYEERLQQTLAGMEDFKKQFKKYEKQLRSKDQEIGDCHSLIDQKDQIIARIERDCDKAVSEMRSFKERCKEVEQELEMFRQGSSENNSIFCNNINQTMASGVGKANLNQTRTNNYDFEIKKIRDMYQQQLAKAKEDSSKYSQMYKDSESKFKMLEEETKKKLHQSITMTNDKFDKD